MPTSPYSASISQRDVGTLAVVLGLVVLLWAFFQFTKIGLALRASALNPDASLDPAVKPFDEIEPVIAAGGGRLRAMATGGRSARRTIRCPLTSSTPL